MLLAIAASLAFANCGRDPSLKDAMLAVPYLPASTSGSLRFDAHPFKNGTAVIGESDMAFWVSEGKVYTVSPQAQAAEPTLPKAPEGIQYDAAFMDDASSEEESAAEKALEEACRLREKGDYEAALQKHIWYHEHALGIDEAQAGVRLSFALSDWMELASKYPKALEALKSIRDRDTARLLKGETEWQLFHDVSSINDNLDDKQATVELFKRIDASDASFAARAYIVAEPDLVEAGEFALAKKYLGDPDKQFDAAKSFYQREAVTHARDEDTREAFAGIFTTKAVSIIKILNETGETAKAKQLQSEALEVVDSPELRNALLASQPPAAE
jgi:tetratricopeptide (TPR) repeat protein